MARITVRCEKYDHFELVAFAAERAKQLSSGAAPTVPRRNDKFTVTALRELEEDNIDTDKIRDIIIAKHQLHGNHDNIEEENMEEVDEAIADVEYISEDHNFDNMSIEEFDNDIFSDDIVEDDNKII